MKNKGFTLIELLAVIVILAIIALIATPIILNIIDDAKKESAERSVELYASAVKNGIAKEQLNGNIVPAGSYELSADKTSLTNENGVTFEVEYDGDVECTTTKIYEDGSIYVEGCTVSGKAVEYTYGTKQIPTPVSFAEDRWETIIENVKAGNLSAYNVGDTKEIALTGFSNRQTDSNGLYTIRIANISTPEQCSTTGFSQTACGFVIEFVDIITYEKMNSSLTNLGGWRDSKMRTYVNSTIYDSLPKELRNNIINTTVVSGYGKRDTANFTTIDKIYLLSPQEVWGEEGKSNEKGYIDKAATKTRKLDYYSNLGVSESNYGARKYGSSSSWWLRTANPTSDAAFYEVDANGRWSSYVASYSSGFGVAPAFRIEIG